MDLIHCNVSPAYKGIQTAQRTGLLAELAALIGCGAGPAYRTADGGPAKATAPRRWWCRGITVTPRYKAAPPESGEIERSAVAPDSGDAVGTPPPEGVTPATVVIL